MCRSLCAKAYKLYSPISFENNSKNTTAFFNYICLQNLANRLKCDEIVFVRDKIYIDKRMVSVYIFFIK